MIKFTSYFQPNYNAEGLPECVTGEASTRTNNAQNATSQSINRPLAVRAALVGVVRMFHILTRSTFQR
jgi:hypothetical protein